MTAVPASITYDGTADVAADLTAWLANPANYPDNIITFQQNGIYRIDDGNVEINGATGLTIDGNGATLKRTVVPTLRYPTYHTSSLYLTGFARNVTIRNLKTLGVNDATPGYLNTWADAETAGGLARFYQSDGTTLQTADPPGFSDEEKANWGCYCVALAFDHAIEIEKARNVIVENCTLTGMFGDGVYFHNGAELMTVQGCTIVKTGRQGVAWNKGSDIYVYNNTISSARHAAIDLECDDNTQTVNRVEIANNFFNSWLTSFASIGPGQVDDVWMHDNTIWRQIVYVGTNAQALKRYRWRIEGNVFNKEAIDTGSGYGAGVTDAFIRFEYYDDVLVRGNRAKSVIGNGTGYGVYLKYATSGAYVESNWWEDCPNVNPRTAEGGAYVQSANNSTTTEPVNPAAAVLVGAGSVSEVRQMGGHLFEWDGSAWRRKGRPFRFFRPVYATGSGG